MRYAMLFIAAQCENDMFILNWKMTAEKCKIGCVKNCDTEFHDHEKYGSINEVLVFYCYYYTE